MWIITIIAIAAIAFLWWLVDRTESKQKSASMDRIRERRARDAKRRQAELDETREAVEGNQLASGADGGFISQETIDASNAANSKTIDAEEGSMPKRRPWRVRFAGNTRRARTFTTRAHAAFYLRTEAAATIVESADTGETWGRAEFLANK